MLDLLPFLGTEQAIRDLDAFRRKLRSPKVWMYGESYGTQFVQQYAARYPGALNGLIIDGVVDLNLDADGYYSENVRTAHQGAAAGLRLAAMPLPNAAPTWRSRLLRSMTICSSASRAGPLEIDFPLADGTMAKRQLSDGMLNATGFYALMGRASRSQLLRGLAAASHGNLVPMLRLGYSNLGLDPQTLEIVPDTSWYGAAYYGITCPDYDDAGSNDPGCPGEGHSGAGQDLAGRQCAPHPLLFRRAPGLRFLAGAGPARPAQDIYRRRVPDPGHERHAAIRQRRSPTAMRFSTG